MTAKPARREAPEKLGNCRSRGQGDGLRRLEAVAQAVEGKMTGLGRGGANGDLELGWEQEDWRVGQSPKEVEIEDRNEEAEESQGTSRKSEQQFALTFWAGGQVPSGRDCPALDATAYYRF